MSSAAEYIPKVPELIALQIKKALPDLRQCEEAPGRFDLEELKRIGAHVPAVRIALLGILPAARGQSYERLDLAAFIVTADERGTPRHRGAQAIAAHLVDLLKRGTKWGEEHLGESEIVHVENLHNSTSGGRGVALWGLRWRQQIAWEFERVESPGSISELYVGMAPKIGAAHEDDYEQIGGSNEP